MLAAEDPLGYLGMVVFETGDQHERLRRLLAPLFTRKRLADLQQFESSGSMPHFLIMRLGNDHTSGTTAGKLTPLSLFADNDYALGMVVEGLSKSRFWPKTAIFVVEDTRRTGRITSTPIGQ